LRARGRGGGFLGSWLLPESIGSEEHVGCFVPPSAKRADVLVRLYVYTYLRVSIGSCRGKVYRYIGLYLHDEYMVW